MFYLLLAMQAAGMVVDYLGTEQQAKLMKAGRDVEQAALDTNLYQTKLAAQEGSLMAMKQLRQTIGSQIAVMSARGTSTSAGSALSILNESLSNFNADEKIRKMNLLSRENALKTQSAMSRLQYNSDTSKLWQSFAQRTFNRFPTSIAAFQGGAQAASGSSQGFGLTTIGG